MGVSRKLDSPCSYYSKIETMSSQKKIAIIYDWIDKWGGVERVLLNLHEIFPNAVFFTSYYDEKKADWAKNLKIKASFLQKFPNFIKKNRILSFIFYPFAFESFNFTEYDLVISVTSSFAKSIITKPSTVHICYLLTPTRYLWSHERIYLNNKLVRSLVMGYLEKIKRWDYIAAQRPDKIISISKTVKERCLKYYKRNSTVVYPGFDAKYWKKISNLKAQISNPQLKSQNYFLVVSRLEKYKKVDLAIGVFNKLNKLLVVVGEGSEEKKLKELAKSNIVFLSKITDAELGGLYENAQALIMPQEEDFGYVALEAQFFNRPIISYKKGGALETIVNNKTGIFFDKQTVASLSRAIERFKKIKYNLGRKVAENAVQNLKRFDKKIFINSFKNVISTLSERKRDEGEKSSEA